MSLEAPATPAAAESQFDNLWQAGAFNADGQPDPKLGQSTPEAPPVQAEAPAVETAPVEARAEPEEETYASIDEYLAHAKLERESFYGLPVTVKIDGESKLVPLADVLKGYQLEGHVQKKSIALADQQRQFESERQAAQQAIGQQLQMAQTLGNLAHQQLLGEYQQIDWNRLRAEDPVAWAVRNQEFQHRANAIAGHLNQVQQAAQQQLAQQQQELATRVVPLEKERMLDARPEWRDQTKFSADRTAMTQYAQRLGFTPAELAGIYDHRYMIALGDAARYAALQAQAPEVTKRVRAAPQVAQPGSRQTRDPQQVARQQSKERFLKNPRDDAVGAAYFETLQ